MSASPPGPAKFGVTFLPGAPEEFVQWCREAEAGGFDLVGVADSQSIYRELYVSAALCAANTEGLRFGPMVTNPVTRHPAVTASAAATLAEAAPDRVILGLGTGDSALHNIEAAPARLAGLREYVTAVRDLLETGRATWQGREARLAWHGPRVPLYIAGSGPRTLELAGELGDGVVVFTGLLPEVVADSIERVRAGAERSGRSLEALDLWWFHWAAVADSREAAVESLKMSLASGAKHLARFTTRGKHIPPGLAPKLEEVMRRYRFDQHQVPGGANVRLIEELELVDYLADRLAVAGTPEQCVAQLERAMAAGARQFCMHVGFADKLGFLRAWSRHVMPAFRR